jgi:hypothetical protein
MSAQPPTETWRPPTLPQTSAFAAPADAVITIGTPARTKTPAAIVCQILDRILKLLARTVAAIDFTVTRSVSS